MPFQSDKQKRWMYANEPEIAREWSDRYGAMNGGIMDIASEGWNSDIDYILDLAATYAEEETGEYECDEFKTIEIIKNNLKSDDLLIIKCHPDEKIKKFNLNFKVENPFTYFI